MYGYKELCCKGKRIIISFLFIAGGKQKRSSGIKLQQERITVNIKKELPNDKEHEILLGEVLGSSVPDICNSIS